MIPMFMSEVPLIGRGSVSCETIGDVVGKQNPLSGKAAGPRRPACFASSVPGDTPQHGSRVAQVRFTRELPLTIDRYWPILLKNSVRELERGAVQNSTSQNDPGSTIGTSAGSSDPLRAGPNASAGSFSTK
jgi:hypothetical protein